MNRCGEQWPVPSGPPDAAHTCARPVAHDAPPASPALLPAWVGPLGCCCYCGTWRGQPDTVYAKDYHRMGR